MSKDNVSFMITEDNYIVENFFWPGLPHREHSIPEISVRIDLEDGDAEFVSISQLAELYRECVVKPRQS